jgi:hypothetical protein
MSSPLGDQQLIELAGAVQKRVSFRRLILSITKAVQPDDALDAAKSLFDTSDATVIEEGSADLEKLYRESTSPTLRYWIVATLAKAPTPTSQGLLRRLQKIEDHPLPANAILESISAQA